MTDIQTANQCQGYPIQCVSNGQIITITMNTGDSMPALRCFGCQRYYWKKTNGEWTLKDIKSKSKAFTY